MPARITFSIPDEIAAAAQKRAEQDRRSLSSYITLLVEGDLRAAGLMPGSEPTRAELIALAEEMGLPAALDHLRKKLRATATKKEAA